jgi:death-on-curing protein
MKYLTLPEIIELHEQMIELEGGLPGIRDENLLHSCVEMPKMSCFGVELYPTIYDKASTYLFHIIQNHPFNDANKRTAVIAMEVFFKVNDVKTNFGDTFLKNLAVSIADGTIKKESISMILENNK